MARIWSLASRVISYSILTLLPQSDLSTHHRFIRHSIHQCNHPINSFIHPSICPSFTRPFIHQSFLPSHYPVTQLPIVHKPTNSHTTSPHTFSKPSPCACPSSRTSSPRPPQVHRHPRSPHRHSNTRRPRAAKPLAT